MLKKSHVDVAAQAPKVPETSLASPSTPRPPVGSVLYKGLISEHHGMLFASSYSQRKRGRAHGARYLRLTPRGHWKREKTETTAGNGSY
eukprot:1846777-Rhodomonas_salina.1